MVFLWAFWATATAISLAIAVRGVAGTVFSGAAFVATTAASTFTAAVFVPPGARFLAHRRTIAAAHARPGFAAVFPPRGSAVRHTVGVGWDAFGGSRRAGMGHRFAAAAGHQARAGHQDKERAKGGGYGG